jgi:hypothetical protein
VSRFPGNQVPYGGPLAGLQDSTAAVLNAADPHHVYLPGPDGSLLTYPRGGQHSVLEDVAVGAAVGFGSWLIWRRMQRRKAAKGEYTSPGFRCLGLLVLPPVIGFALALAWPLETDKFLGLGVVAGAVLAAIYAVYRITGHGAYNSRRAGSPWRSDHRRDDHQDR